MFVTCILLLILLLLLLPLLIHSFTICRVGQTDNQCVFCTDTKHRKRIGKIPRDMRTDLWIDHQIFVKCGHNCCHSCKKRWFNGESLSLREENDFDYDLDAFRPRWWKDLHNRYRSLASDYNQLKEDYNKLKQDFEEFKQKNKECTAWKNLPKQFTGSVQSWLINTPKGKTNRYSNYIDWFLLTSKDVEGYCGCTKEHIIKQAQMINVDPRRVFLVRRRIYKYHSFEDDSKVFGISPTSLKRNWNYTLPNYGEVMLKNIY